MNRNHAVVCPMLFLPFSAIAVEPLPYQTDSGIDIIPTIEMSVGHNDNVRRTENDTVSSPRFVISPKVIAQLETDRGAYQFDYRFDAFQYSNSSDDDFIDHRAHAAAYWMFDIRNRLRLDYVFRITHEPRGTGLTEGISLAVNEPLRFNHQDLNARYTYGAAGAKGRLVGIIGYEDKKYKDATYVRNSQVEQTRYYDWEQPYLSGEFYYALSNYFHAVTIARFEDRSYQYVDPDPGYTRDSKNTFLYGGLEWEVTGKTKGTVLVGWQDKDFEDHHRSDFNGFSWRLNLSWAPTDFSEFRLEGRDYARDPDIQGDYVEDQSIRLEWDHKWTPRFGSVMTTRYGVNDYPGIRKDKDTTLGLTFVYSLQRWWDISFGASHFDRDSTFNGYSYDQTLYFIGTEISL
ncbi:outer membrane beta-barrel protein [Enterovibrio sp. ZSDZ35]|uniref:Outer membrane beta-barrel protein n=1 Tax=Enterovibrio qingdaonensis TaxID=2899818 RepID=A0ABT5QMG7_9GAMM|nr:outer membrane beta-barrel protein [Enterovibrio sp. ZSDZ35]MDD1782185.1 outer membrane beta-barrel protein [Enterovibrio sp. ZSDZ35]